MVKIYEVGGSVRDSFLNTPTKDYDYCVEADSYEQMKQFLVDDGLEIFLETPEYFTIRGFNRKKYPLAADYVWCRVEGPYSDGRHPDWVKPGTLLDDLSRRDFTCNAIAKDVDTGRIIDPFNGQKDIASFTIRCVGNVEDRMREDALRMLRAIRFCITKNMRISREITEFIDNVDNINLLKNISSERIREELRKCFEFDTNSTLEVLERFKYLRFFIFNNTNIWLMPTQEKRKK